MKEKGPSVELQDKSTVSVDPIKIESTIEEKKQTSD